MKSCKETMSESGLSQLLDLYAASLSQADDRYKIFTGANPVTDNDFLEWRYGDSCFSIQFLFMLVGTGNKISDKLLQDPNYLGLNKQAAIHASLVNDLYSLRKEVFLLLKVQSSFFVLSFFIRFVMRCTNTIMCTLK